MSKPETRYAQSGEVHIAYQVVGAGPIDLVFALGWVTNLDVMWDCPVLSRFLMRLASFSRLILFDKRGVGLSDRTPATASLEQRMDDVRAVMDAAGSARAALMGVSEGAPMCLLFAATYPERAAAVVINGGYAARLRTEETPSGPTREDFAAYVDHQVKHWGEPILVERFAPSRKNDPSFLSWWRRYLQLSASPASVRALGQFYPDIDVRDVLGSIHCPTLVAHARGDRLIGFDYAEAIARRVPGAKLVALPGEDHLPWAGDYEPLIAEVQEFLTGVRPPPRVDRVLATMLCTDIVDSTKRAAEVGDAHWRRLVEAHDLAARREVERAHGRLIKTLGDGVLASFDGPARAIRCAEALRERAADIGLPIRAGLHTGEVELRDGDVTGIAVNIGARVAALGGSGEILVSRTVKDLVVGSGIAFEDRGEHALKGVPDTWRLFAVASDRAGGNSEAAH